MHKMSLIVVGNGPNASKGPPVLSPSPHGPSRPPPAHVTQLTSSPHVVQHHPLPAPTGGRLEHLSYPSRPLPLSPQRASQPPLPTPHHARHRSGLAGGNRSSAVGASAAPCLPQSPLPYVLPSPAHQLLPATSVNSPSLIPQNIPPSFLPHLASMGAIPGGPHSPQLGPGYGALPSDSTILPPNAFKKLTRNTNSVNVDDDVEVNDPSPNVGRRNFISPRQRDRRNYFSSLALQDHNYCAPPLPSPARSPTPPPSPYSHSLNMGVQPSPSQEQQQQQPPPQHQPPLNNDDQSFTFGIASYKASSGGGGASVGAFPSAHYSGAPPAPMQPSPVARLKQTIHEAGVGPMTPLGEEESPLSGDKSHESRPSLDGDGGEETETAPEADDETVEDSVTRCICDFLHDDGYMICCDKCTVWQHVVCMGLDKNNIPEEYLCEKCQPRPVDKKRAKALQRTREKEIFARLNFDSSDDEKKPLGPTKARKPLAGSGIKKTLGLKKAFNAGEKRPEKKNLKKTLKRRSGQLSKAESSAVNAGGLVTSGGSSVANKTETAIPAKKLSPRKGQRRKSSVTDADSEEENANDTMALRSWIDTYEEAVTNHYSPELRARLQGAKLPNHQFKPKDVNGIRCNVSLRGNGVKVLTANSHIPANTPVIECRGKYMLASQLAAGRGRAGDFVLFHRISPDLEVCVESKTYGNDSRFCRRADTALAECNAEVKHHLDKGSLHLYIVSTKVIEKNQEILLPPENKNGILPPLSIKDELRQIKKVNGLLDEKKVKKVPNLKRRVKREIVKKEQADDSSSEDDMPVSLRKTRSTAEKSVNFDLKSGGPADGRERREKEDATSAAKEVKFKAEREPSPPAAVEVKLEPKVDAVEKETVVKKEVEEEEKTAAKEVKEIGHAAAGPEPTEALKIDIGGEEDEEEDEPAASPPDESKEGPDASPAACQSHKEKKAAAVKSPEMAPLCSPVAAKSPGKPALGLPDQSGLIVGVNTINYDVALRNKSKTREEKKMEMILKAIEAMERAEARKRSDPTGLGSSGGGESFSERSSSSKRRRSSSTKKESVDSAVDASSADEGGNGIGETKIERPRLAKGRRRRNTTLRRRSRAKSGDSTSAMSADEGGGIEGMSNADSEAASTPGEMQPFKFPRHKKQLASESFNPDSEDVDDDVSGNYLRGSRSPPGIANHLLRSAVTSTPLNACPKSPTKSIGCSAKKRWLRAAMSEDHSEEGGAGAGGASPEPDCTPLKKRRLATYKETAETAEKLGKETLQDVDVVNLSKMAGPISDRMKSLPNGLKERLISSIVRDAVLEKAIEDALPKEEESSERHKETSGSLLDTAETAKDIKTAASTAGSPHRKRKGATARRGKGKRPTEPEDEGLPRSTGAENDGLGRSKDGSAPLIPPPTPDEVALPVSSDGKEPSVAAKSHLSNDVGKPIPVADTRHATEVPAGFDFTDSVVVETVRESLVAEDRPLTRLDHPLIKEDRPPIVEDRPPVKKDRPPVKEDQAPVKEDRAPVKEDRPPVKEDRPPVKEDLPRAPVQHSVFKSFFSMDLSFDDIDRQIEAKRMELARESAAAVGIPSRQESLAGDSGSRLSVITMPDQQLVAAALPAAAAVADITAAAAVPPLSPAPQTPGPKKRVTIADYKRRREASRTEGSSTERGGGGEEDEKQQVLPLLSAQLPLLSSLPELPGLESRRSNHHQATGAAAAHPPHKTRGETSSPKRVVSSTAARKHEKWESKSKEIQSKVRPGVSSSSSSNLKKSRSVPEPVSGSSSRIVQPPPPPPPPAAAPVPVYTPRPPIPTPDAPREDLTERLRKEFGLSIEDSEEGEEEEEDGSDTDQLVNSNLVSGFVSANSSLTAASGSQHHHHLHHHHRPPVATNHVGSGGQQHRHTTDHAADHGWPPTVSQRGGGGPAPSSRTSPGSGAANNSSYWADVSYRNSFRHT